MTDVIFNSGFIGLVVALCRQYGGTGDSHSLYLDIAQILVYLFRVQGEVDFVG